MKVLGLVEWTTLDKNGHDIAGVKPLCEVNSWRLIDAEEEFPSQGQAFWPNAQNATKDTLVIFRAEKNVSKNKTCEFTVVEPRPVCEVVDLRRCASTEVARIELLHGARVPGPVGIRSFLVWCHEDVLVGPVELERNSMGIATLSGANKHTLAMYSGVQVQSIFVDRSKRLVRVDEDGPSGHVDWDDDAIVLRRALEAAVRVARNAGHDPGTTKRQLEEAARALANQVGPQERLDSYRLQRAIALLGKGELVARYASDLVGLLGDHPSIKASIESLRTEVREDTEQSFKAELQRELSRECAELKEVAASHARAKEDYGKCENELSALKQDLATMHNQVANAVKAVEEAVDERLLAAMERPLELLAEVSVLRPLLGSRSGNGVISPPQAAQVKLDWRGASGGDISDKAALSRVLTSAARARGVDPSLMLQIHAAVIARLVPVTAGPGALAALTAYADAACAGRMLIVHVSPSSIHPKDLHDPPGGGLSLAAAAARDVDGLSLAILEGVNRAPIEGAVVPTLQLAELGMTPLLGAGGLRLAASLVAGATTVPVTPQLWNHAVAVYSDPCGALSSASSASGAIRLASDLLVPGDEPSDVIGALLDTWPDCRELRPAMGRYGSALARFYTEQRVNNELLNGLVLPFIATALSIEEQADAVARVGDADGTLGLALGRLRRRLT